MNTMDRRPFAEGSFRLAFHGADNTNAPVILKKYRCPSADNVLRFLDDLEVTSIARHLAHEFSQHLPTNHLRVDFLNVLVVHASTPELLRDQRRAAQHAPVDNEGCRRERRDAALKRVCHVQHQLGLRQHGSAQRDAACVLALDPHPTAG